MEVKELLNQARHEIIRLRRNNEIMGAQLEVVEIFRAALMGPRPPMQYLIDIAAEIEKHLAEGV
jgi:hypothetical protein